MIGCIASTCPFLIAENSLSDNGEFCFRFQVFLLYATQQEKKVERYRLQYEKDGSSRRDYREALRKLGDLLMNEGFARRAKQYYRKADQLENS